VKYPIPDDWDGQTWECYQIQFPSSLRWDAILNGWLSSLFKGRVWDETTGQITAVQAIMREMWLRNKDLAACDLNCQECSDHTCEGGGCASTDCESENETMPCLNLSSLLKIEDGSLYAKDDCCNWVLIGEIAGLEESPPDDFGDVLDPPATYSACGKAVAIVDAIYQVAQAIFEETDVSNPLSWYSDIRAACPGLNLKSKFLLEGILDAMLLKDFDYTEEEVFDAASHQEIICKLERSLPATGTALTEDEYKSIETAFNQNLGFDVAIFGAAANALGKSQLSNLAMAGSLSADADCDCPSMAADPTEGWTDLDWTIWIPLTLSPQTAIIISTPNTSLWTVNKGWFKADRDSGYQSPQLNIDALYPHDDSYLTRVQITLSVPNQMDWIATKGWLQRSYQSQSIIDSNGLTGGDPSVGGNQYLQGSCNTQCNAATFPLKLGFEGDAAIPADETLYITGIALGGTGLNPFTEPVV